MDSLWQNLSHKRHFSPQNLLYAACLHCMPVALFCTRLCSCIYTAVFVGEFNTCTKWLTAPWSPKKLAAGGRNMFSDCVVLSENWDSSDHRPPAWNITNTAVCISWLRLTWVWCSWHFSIGVGAQSTLGRQDNFGYEKLTKCPNFTRFLPEKLSKYQNFYDICPKN